jgi:hypothetical protein
MRVRRRFEEGVGSGGASGPAANRDMIRQARVTPLTKRLLEARRPS